MNFRLIPYKHIFAALAAGLVLRLFFVFHFSFVAGDTKFYEEIARNWIDHGVYGLFDHGQLTPVDVRMPGYPAFVAAIYALIGRTGRAVMFAQVVIDLMTCFLTAMIAALLASASRKKTVATLALWMAALCPFTANYTAVVLSETLAIFLTVLGILFFAGLLGDPSMEAPLDARDRKKLLSFVGWWLLGGLLIGLGTLVRPEAPLLWAAMGIVLLTRWGRKANWSKLAIAGLWMTVGLLFTLLPWAVRNARTMGRVEFLSPRYAETHGDFIPRGFFAWTQTWMVHFGDSYTVTWKLRRGPILVETLPLSAFDSDAEKIRVEILLSRYNADFQMTPDLDRAFDDLARERTTRHPLRTYLYIPVMRGFTMWFAPRIELLPYSGKLWPPGEKWRANPADFGTTLGYGLVNILYVALALMGAWRSRRHPAFVLLIVYVVLRTMVLTQLQTVEPRYVIECYPLAVALGAAAWGRQRMQLPAREALI